MAKQEPRIMVAIPNTGLVDIRWVFSTWQLLVNTPPGSPYSAEWRYGIAHTREVMVEHTLKNTSATHILFLDSDVMPPPDGALRLLQDDREVVSGLYFNSLHTGVAAWVGDRTIALEQPGELVQVDKVGMGFCLIDLDVFRDMKDDRPWFYYKSSDAEMISEDFYFFEQAAKHGIKPWVDMRVKCRHIKPFFLEANGQIGV